MKHHIEVTEDKKGFIIVRLDRELKAHGVTKDQAHFFISGLKHGIEINGGSWEINDEFYEIFS